ncbi:MAG: Uma2 family endonuclease [Phormidium sp.]
MVAAVQIQTYTVEEFLNLDLPEGQEYELVNGIIVHKAEPSGEHENLRSELLVELRNESKRRQLGLLLHPKPVLQLSPKDTRKPDLIPSTQYPVPSPQYPVPSPQPKKMGTLLPPPKP